MNYKIVDVEGIGNVYAEKLIAAGIESTVDSYLGKSHRPYAYQWRWPSVF